MAKITSATEPLACGIIPTAKQSFRDPFRWQQQVELVNDYDETTYVWQKTERLQKPVSLMAQLSAKGWTFFLIGHAAWTADAFDFHALSIQTVELAAHYDTSKTDVTTASTLSLLLYSVGAAFFGLAGDKFGRKYTMIVNVLILGPLQNATIYCGTFGQVWLSEACLVLS